MAATSISGRSIIRNARDAGENIIWFWLTRPAHDEGYLTDAFPAAIAPTLLDYAGSVVEASTPNGVSPDNHFWQAAHLAELGFVVHHASDCGQSVSAAGRDRGAAGDHAAGDRQPGT